MSLQTRITPDQWTQICNSIRNTTARAHCFSCCLEAVCCLVFTFPCIFLCHPCCYMCWSGSLLQSEVQRLNRSHFGGSAVLSYSDGVLTVNTAALGAPSMMLGNQIPIYISDPIPVTPAYNSNSTASNTSKYSPIASQEAVVVAQPVTVSAVPYQPQQHRTIFITVPNQAIAGQSFPFSSPTGQIVQVTIPPGAVAGQRLLVYY